MKKITLKITAPKPVSDKGKMPLKPMGDNRAGRLTDTKTDRGTFRFKANKKGE